MVIPMDSLKQNQAKGLPKATQMEIPKVIQMPMDSNSAILTSFLKVILIAIRLAILTLTAKAMDFLTAIHLEIRSHSGLNSVILTLTQIKIHLDFQKPTATMKQIRSGSRSKTLRGFRLPMDSAMDFPRVTRKLMATMMAIPIVIRLEILRMILKDFLKQTVKDSNFQTAILKHLDLKMDSLTATRSDFRLKIQKEILRPMDLNSDSR